MRAARGAGRVLMLALGACSSSANSGGAADAGPRVQPALLRCEVLLPADVRELALPGFTLEESRPCPSCGPLCALRSEAEPEVRVSLAYDCQARYAGAPLDSLLAPTLKAGGVEVPAMGRAAARRAPAQGMLQVLAWDDDTPCALVVTWLGGDSERALELTRLALRAATPASVTAPLPTPLAPPPPPPIPTAPAPPEPVDSDVPPPPPETLPPP